MHEAAVEALGKVGDTRAVERSSRLYRPADSSWARKPWEKLWNALLSVLNRWLAGIDANVLHEPQRSTTLSVY